MNVPDYLETLNPIQKEATIHGASPLLVLAGAGSGKTRVITARIAYLIAEMGFLPTSILAVTFTNKAANEMRERVEHLIGSAEGLMVKTFHSFGAWLLRRNAAAMDLASHFTIYDRNDTLALLKTLFPGKKTGEYKLIASYLDRAKNQGLSPSDTHLDELFFRIPNFASIYDTYESRLRAIGGVDFGDLILLPIRLLRDNPAIRAKLTQQIRVLLVDEYQDTNIAQTQLLELLTGEDTWLCAVGDDDQSIYRFRGAEVRNILHFSGKFPGTRILKMEENYRSTGRILSIASSVVSANHRRLGKTLWTRNEEGKRPVLALVSDQNHEAEYCAETALKAPLGKTAILYRTNAQSRAFENCFRRRGLPYRLIGARSFFEREEIKDTIAYCAFIMNARDEISFSRIVNKPARSIGKSSLAKIGALAKESDSDYERACLLFQKNQSPRKADQVGSFLAIIQELRSHLPDQPLPLFIQDLLEKTGLLEHYEGIDAIESTQKAFNLKELITLAAEFPHGIEGLSSFLEQVGLEPPAPNDHGSQGREEGSITLITLHNTKGLEFDRVIITGMEEGLFPNASSTHDLDELEEERRLFYVGITRARKELFFTACSRRMLYGRYQDAPPSRFLEDIPEEDLEVLPSSPTGKSKGRVEGILASPTTKINNKMIIYHTKYGEGHVIQRFYKGDRLYILVQFIRGGEPRSFSPSDPELLGYHA